MGAAIVSLGAAAAAPSTIEGEVTAVEQRVMAGTGQPFTEIAVRTREHQQLRVRLGPSEGTPPCATGDRVRLRLMRGDAIDGAVQARAMWNRATNRRVQFRDGNGGLVRDRIRERARDGSCDGEPRRARRHRSETSSQAGRRGGSAARGGNR